MRKRASSALHQNDSGLIECFPPHDGMFLFKCKPFSNLPFQRHYYLRGSLRCFPDSLQGGKIAWKSLCQAFLKLYSGRSQPESIHTGIIQMNEYSKRVYFFNYTIQLCATYISQAIPHYHQQLVVEDTRTFVAVNRAISISRVSLVEHLIITRQLDLTNANQKLSALNYLFSESTDLSVTLSTGVTFK